MCWTTISHLPILFELRENFITIIITPWSSCIVFCFCFCLCLLRIELLKKKKKEIVRYLFLLSTSTESYFICPWGQGHPKNELSANLLPDRSVSNKQSYLNFNVCENAHFCKGTKINWVFHSSCQWSFWMWINVQCLQRPVRAGTALQLINQGFFCSHCQFSLFQTIVKGHQRCQWSQAVQRCCRELQQGKSCRRWLGSSMFRGHQWGWIASTVVVLTAQALGKCTMCHGVFLFHVAWEQR